MCTNNAESLAGTDGVSMESGSYRLIFWINLCLRESMVYRSREGTGESATGGGSSRGSLAIRDKVDSSPNPFITQTSIECDLWSGLGVGERGLQYPRLQQFLGKVFLYYMYNNL